MSGRKPMELEEDQEDEEGEPVTKLKTQTCSDAHTAWGTSDKQNI